MSAYTAEGMAAAMGTTYRQLDYWCRQGFIKPTPLNNGEERKAPGSGKNRFWTGREALVAIAFAHLVEVGFRPQAIGDLAEHLVDKGRATLPFGMTVLHGRPCVRGCDDIQTEGGLCVKCAKDRFGETP